MVPLPAVNGFLPLILTLSLASSLPLKCHPPTYLIKGRCSKCPTSQHYNQSTFKCDDCPLGYSNPHQLPYCENSESDAESIMPIKQPPVAIGPTLASTVAVSMTVAAAVCTETVTEFATSLTGVATRVWNVITETTEGTTAEQVTTGHKEQLVYLFQQPLHDNTFIYFLDILLVVFVVLLIAARLYWRWATSRQLE